MSLAEVAARSGVSVGSASRIENGRQVASEDVTAKLAVALDVRPEVLTGQRPVLGALLALYDLSAASLAADLGVSVERIGAIQTGADFPVLALAEAIGRRLSVPVDALFPSLDLAAAS